MRLPKVIYILAVILNIVPYYGSEKGNVRKKVYKCYSVLHILLVTSAYMYSIYLQYQLHDPVSGMTNTQSITDHILNTINLFHFITSSLGVAFINVKLWILFYQVNSESGGVIL